MYSDVIFSQLGDLKYLKPLKNSNISILSKKNKFGDVVKFFAQIDDGEVIRKITFKATGCSFFLVFCNYFCQIAEGKLIDEVLSFTAEDLQKLVSLSESKIHVIDIILSTFTLMIKKYRKGVKKGTIIPIDNSVFVTSTNFSDNISEEQIVSEEIEKEDKVEVIVNEHDKEENIDIQEELVKLNKEIETEEKKLESHVKEIKENKKNKKITIDSRSISSKTIIENDKLEITNEKELNNENAKQTNNFNSLKLLIENKEKHDFNEIKQDKISSLNSMLGKIQKTSQKQILSVEEDTKDDKSSNLSSIKSGLNSLHNRQKFQQEKKHKVDENSIKKENKKGLFSWFKK